MTLQEFREETALFDGATEILVLSPWGEMEPGAFVGRADLAVGDPVRDSFPANSILLTGEAS